MKLEIEFMPRNVLKFKEVVGSHNWDTIRRAVYKKDDHKCVICGASGKMFCHEIYEYDYANKIQNFIGLESLCAHCFNFKRYDIVLKGHVTDNKEHFMKINECGEEIYNSHVEAVKVRYTVYNNVSWRQPWIDQVNV